MRIQVDGKVMLLLLDSANFTCNKNEYRMTAIPFVTSASAGTRLSLHEHE